MIYVIVTLMGTFEQYQPHVMSQDCLIYMMNKVSISSVGFPTCCFQGWLQIGSTWPRRSMKKDRHLHPISSTDLQFHCFSSHFILIGWLGDEGMPCLWHLCVRWRFGSIRARAADSVFSWPGAHHRTAGRRSSVRYIGRTHVLFGLCAGRDLELCGALGKPSTDGIPSGELTKSNGKWP